MSAAPAQKAPTGRLTGGQRVLNTAHRSAANRLSSTHTSRSPHADHSPGEEPDRPIVGCSRSTTAGASRRLVHGRPGRLALGVAHLRLAARPHRHGICLARRVVHSSHVHRRRDITAVAASRRHGRPPCSRSSNQDRLPPPYSKFGGVDHSLGCSSDFYSWGASWATGSTQWYAFKDTNMPAFFFFLLVRAERQTPR